MTTPTTPANTPCLDLKPLTTAQLDRARQVLAAGRYIARQKAPYFSSVLLKLVVREVPPSPEFFTVAVTDGLIMLTCMEYVATLTPEEMAGDFLHESLHVLERHGARRGQRDPRTWNEAADLAINTITRDMGVKQTPIALWPKAYGFKEHLAADEYYALLQKKNGEGNGSSGPSSGQPTPGGGGQPGQPTPGGGGQPGGSAPPGHPQPGGGHCGSCAGHAVPNEPGGTDPDGRSASDVETAVRDVAQAIKSAASKSRGTIPAGLLQFADDALAPAKIPWQVVLGRAIRGACAWTAGAVDHRYDAPGRRQACIGYGPGRPVMPRLRRPQPRVCVCVDTSGSMGRGPGSPLADACVETLGVIKAIGSDVDFLAVDAVVHASRKVRGVTDLLASIKGGGGTSFVPGFQAADRLKPRPNVLIYATDGYGNAPTTPPPRMKVIWLLIGKGAPVPAPWGEVVRIED